MSKTTYAIIGSGALGGLYGAMLARAGHEVHFLLNSDYQHVRQHGWKIESRWGDFDLPDVHAHQSCETIPECDVTLVGLKTVHNELLSAMLPQTCGDRGVVLVLQNGLGIEQQVSKLIPTERVFGGCCFLCSNKVGPGHIRHLDYGRIVFGPLDATEPAMRIANTIRDDLTGAGIEAEASDDLNTVRWRKLMWNIPFNGLSVALDSSTDKLIGTAESVELIRDIITEVFQAGRACGAKLEPEWIEMTIDHTRQMVPYDSSMRLDFLASRPMELQAIIRNPIDTANAAGVAMPKTEMLYQMLCFIESNY